MDLTADERASYASIIDKILSSSDITTVSEKRIRRRLEEVIGQDLTPRKDAVNKLIIQRFDLFVDDEENGTAVNGNGLESQSGAASVSHSGSSASPQKRSADLDSSAGRPLPPPANKKRKGDVVDSDAVYAARLQAEENLRARPTRAGNTRKAPTKPKKKKPSQPKGSKKVSPEDDSDDVGTGEPKKEVNRSGGFHKPLNLSAPLSSLLGESTVSQPDCFRRPRGTDARPKQVWRYANVHQLSRPQTVKKVWEYIRENQLQDPTDKRHILCDEPMQAVFKQDRIHMFTMTKVLSQNLYSPDE